MQVQLTDHLICPACDEGSGLVLLADQAAGRSVVAGQLGCPGCRARFPVVDGVARFAGPAAPSQAGAAPPGPILAALMGVTEGPATILLVGAYRAAAEAVAALLEDVEVVVADGDAAPAAQRISVLQIGERIPLRDGSMRAVVLDGTRAPLVPEAVRVAGLAARVVLLGGDDAARAALRAQNVQVVVAQDDTLVSVRTA